jgi:radical SAM protein with 4Fe4S-binding SPASM domain
MAVDKDNFHDIENTLLLARELGASVFSYTPILPLGRAKILALENWDIERKQVYETEKELIEKYRGFLGLLSPDMTCDLENGENCGAGYRTYAMNPWGHIRPCPLYEDTEFEIGNLAEQDIEEVFSNPLTFAFAKISPPIKNICRDCERKYYCMYCSLRGFQSQKVVQDCRWSLLPEVAAVAAFRS